MAHTRFGNVSATIEIPAAYGKLFFRNTQRVFEKIMRALEARRDD
jgi:hypothetical protein